MVPLSPDEGQSGGGAWSVPSCPRTLQHVHEGLCGFVCWWIRSVLWRRNRTWVPTETFSRIQLKRIMLLHYDEVQSNFIAEHYIACFILFRYTDFTL